MSVFFALTELIASYTTAEASAPSVCFTILTFALSAQTESWSAAAALNVSPAAMVTLLPSLENLFASFPIEIIYLEPNVFL